MTTPPKLPLTTHNATEDKLRVLKDHFPEVFTEGNFIDWDKLRLTLGETLESEDPKERFGLNWPGKRNCFKAIQAPTTATLLPDRGASVDFDTTENLYIEGDNLEVLKLLQKSYLGKVKMIYIDPPYNTGNDFVYPDDYTESLKTYLEYTGQVDAHGRKFSNNTETTGRFHSKWLNMMYPRLFLARNLLREDGVIFISIDDGEVAHLRKVCDEIFGEENFVGSIVRTTGQTTGQDSDGLGSSFDYLLVYSKAINRGLNGLPLTENDLKRFENEDERGKYAYDQMRKTGSNDKREDRPNMYYSVIDPDGNDVLPIGPGGYQSCWRFEKKTYEKLLDNKFILWKKTKRDDIEIWWPYVKYYLEGRTKRPSPLWDDLEGNKKASRDLRQIFEGKKFFDFPKPLEMIKRIINISCDNDSIILDFFSGSATTAHAVLALNAEDRGSRKFICVQLPEPTRTKKADGTWEESEAYKAGFSTIAEIGKERIRRVITKLKEEGSANKGKATGGKKTVKIQAFQANEEAPSLGFERTDDQLTHNGGTESPRKSQDLGFRVFKLAPSNFPVWNGNVEKSKEALEEVLFATPEFPTNDPVHGTEEAILFEVLLKSGLNLALANPSIRTETIAGKIVYIAEETAYYVLGNSHSSEVFDEIMKRSPSQVVVRESGFGGNDVLKANVHAQFKQMKDVRFLVV